MSVKMKEESKSKWCTTQWIISPTKIIPKCLTKVYVRKFSVLTMLSCLSFNGLFFKKTYIFEHVKKAVSILLVQTGWICCKNGIPLNRRHIVLSVAPLSHLQCKIYEYNTKSGHAVKSNSKKKWQYGRVSISNDVLCPVNQHSYIWTNRWSLEIQGTALSKCLQAWPVYGFFFSAGPNW